MNLRLSCLILWVFLINLSKTAGQNGNFTQYSIREGLPQSQVYSLCQDSLGKIWAATQGGGVAVFDGANFKTLGERQGLNNTMVNSLYTSSDHKVWIGTPSGIQYFKGPDIVSSRFNVYTSCFLEHGGQMYFGTSKGLYTSDMDLRVIKPVVFAQKPKEIKVNDLKTLGNRIWIASEKGLFILDATSKKTVKVAGLPYPNIQRILVTDDGFVWLAIVGFGIIKLDHQARIIGQITNTEIVHPTDMMQKNGGEIWISTEDNGIMVFDDCTGNISQITEGKGLKTNRVMCLLKDHWNNIWIGTSGEGVLRHTSQLFSYYNLYDHGFSGNRIYAMTGDTTGGIWMSVNQGILGYFNENKFRQYTFDSLPLNTKIRSMASDNYGRIWLGTEGKGLLIMDSTRIINVSRILKSPDSHIIQILPGRDSGVWVATQRSGIMFISLSKNNQLAQVRSFTINDGLPDKFVNCMAGDKITGRIWFGCRNGTAGYIAENSEIFSFGNHHGLPGQSVKTMCTDSSGRVYLAIVNQGVYTTFGNQNPRFNPIKGISSKDYSRNIYSMVVDLSGFLWLGSENGAFKCRPDSLFNSFQEISHYDSDAGFYGIENCHNSIYRGSSGEIWFGTLNGLVGYRNESISSSDRPPILRLEEVLLFNSKIEATKFKSCFKFDDETGGLRKLPHNQNHLSVVYKAIHLNFPDKLKYRYTLSDSDADWSAWSDQNRINFSSLPPGNYHFRVQATHDEKLISNTAGLKFIIAQPFWQTFWFRSIGMLFFLSLVTAIFLIREKKIKIRAREQKALLEQENKLLSLEQKALQLQMNPHFIFNSLNSIQSLVAREKTEEARKQIQNFATLMRSLLNNSRKSSISLYEEIKYLEEYLKMEQFCQKNIFNYTIRLHELEDPENIMLPSMLIQPYVENAVIHGISHLSGRDGIITLDFSIEKEHLICEITDNGVGRERAVELSAARQNGHVSMGMEVTKQRLYAITSHNPKAQIITDLKDDAGRPCGTKVTLKIPIMHSY